MNFFHIWLITITVSLIMKITNKIEMYKDVADRGYILNHHKLNILCEKIEEDLDTTSKLLTDLGLIIPFYNLFTDVIRESNYYNNIEDFINWLKKCNVLEEMTNEEKEEYNKSKTGINAWKIEHKKWKKLMNADFIGYEDGSIIWFDYKDSFEEEVVKDKNNFMDNIIILYTEGEVSKLSLEEKKKIVYKVFLDTINIDLSNDDNKLDPLNTEENPDTEVVDREINPIEIEKSSEQIVSEHSKKRVRSRKKRIEEKHYE